MKKTAIEALKSKFEGVSESMLSRVADKIAKTATTIEDVTTSVEGMTWQTLMESYADSRATEAQKTAVSNYERKHNLKDGQKVNATQAGAETDPDTPAWAKSLTEQMMAMSQRIGLIEGEKIHNSRKQQLDALVGKLPETLRKPYARMAYKDLSEEDFGSLLTEVGAEVEAVTKEVSSTGAVFGKPRASQGGADKTATDAEADAVVAGMPI
jgi:hypothetical protein